MKNYKQPLEAINRGIQFALDDFDDEVYDSPKKEIIKNQQFEKNYLKLNTLIQKFKEQLKIDHYIFVSKNDLMDIANLSKQFDYKFKVIDLNELKNIIKIVCKIDIFANLNWLDVSKLTSLADAFNQTAFVGDISEWDVSNIKTLYSCFAYSEFNGDLSKWNVSNVYDISWLFQESQFNNKSICNWNTSNVLMMIGTFENAEFDQDISKWNVDNVKNSLQVFANCKMKEEYKPEKLKEQNNE